MKNYFLTHIKPDERYSIFHSHGWEIQIFEDRYALDIPKYVPSDTKKDIRKHFNVFLRIARAVYTHEEFREVYKRINYVHHDYIIDNDLKGTELVLWAKKQLTNSEAFSSFWRG